MTKDNLISRQPETHEKRTETHACDCISRQAAIDRATKEHDFFRGAVTVSDKARRDELLNVVCWLGELPTIKPRKGKWIYNREYGTAKVWTCSECGWNDIGEWNFYPNCGADMRGEEE